MGFHASSCYTSSLFLARVALFLGLILGNWNFSVWLNLQMQCGRIIWGVFERFHSFLCVLVCHLVYCLLAIKNLITAKCIPSFYVDKLFTKFNILSSLMDKFQLYILELCFCIR